jgi:2-polyprenyl-6-methoxyphenol hydroxylase-like FAD-dependent oxidoreductase
VKRLHALVIGAGIGGMAAAIALRRAGLDISLFEQTIAQREVGAGIQISPNASRLLSRYGLGDAMARVAVRPSAIVFRRWQDGRVLGREELGKSIESQYGAPTTISTGLTSSTFWPKRSVRGTLSLDDAWSTSSKTKPA